MVPIIDYNAIVEIKAPYAAKDTLNTNKAIESGKEVSIKYKQSFLYTYLVNNQLYVIEI